MKTGKVSESVLKRSILKQIKTKRNEVLSGAVVGGDCAIFALSEEAVTTDNQRLSGESEYMLASCMREAAVAVSTDKGIDALPIGAIIQKCVNNLVTSGATPVAILITLLLPEETEEGQIKQIMSDAEEACSSLSIQIAGGQTRVTKAVNTPYAVITGYGKLKRDALHTRKAAKPGWDIVISKWIGLEGTALLASKNRERLLQRYPAYLVEEAAGFGKYLSIISEASIANRFGVGAMHDASEGGIFGALWELAEGAGVGMSVDLKKLPLRQETVEVCECLNVNPYELMSGGCLIMTTEDGPGLVTALHQADIPAVIVGKLTDSNDRILYNEEEVRYMDKPKMDEIYKGEK